MQQEAATVVGHALPPGQRRVEGFPRFGSHLHHPPPTIPAVPVIEIAGALTKPVVVPVADLASLPRRELTADFHCVAGWSATDLHWEGVGCETFYRAIIEPALPPGITITHLVFQGIDGYRSIARLEDVLSDDVLLADRLDGRPLNGDHGAPVRLVSPDQYGYVSTKHLCRIEVQLAEPAENFGSASRLAGLAFRTPLLRRHPRARVWEEERHPTIPAQSLRWLYRLFIPPIAFLCRLGSSARQGRS